MCYASAPTRAADRDGDDRRRARESTMNDTAYGAAPLQRARAAEDARAASRNATTRWLAGALTFALLLGAGAVARTRRGDVGSDVVDVISLGQGQTSADKVREVIVDSLDHLGCTDTCKKCDTLAAKVDHNDTSLVCADFKHYAHDDECVKKCKCEDRTVITTVVDYLCGSNPPSDPEDVHAKRFYESMTDAVIAACPPTQ